VREWERESGAVGAHVQASSEARARPEHGSDGSCE
jgi:hypothetical protein